MKRLERKIAVVTGSSSGIGKAIALQFGHEGATVVVAARRVELCEQVAAQIRSRRGEAVAIKTDVTKETQVETLLHETVSRYGRIDVLVNNAGVFGGGRMLKTSTAQFDHVMETNLRGTFFAVVLGFKS